MSKKSQKSLDPEQGLPQYFSLVTGKPLKIEYQFYRSDDGARLAYRYLQRKGKSRQTLILLHGLGSSGADWEFQIPALIKHFNLLIPDLRGFGASTSAYFEQPHGRLTVKAMANDVSILLDELGIFSCPVLGYSMGGAVALQMAVNHLDIASSMNPMNPSKMLILNSLPSFELDTIKKKYLGMLRLGLNKLLSIPRMAEMLSKNQFPDNEFLRQGIVKRISMSHKKPYTAALNSLLGWHIRDDLSKLKQETLFVTADEDYSPVADKKKYAKKMPYAKVEVIKNSKHGTPFDQAKQLNQVVIDYFRE